jgi:hypothetical protein
MSVVGSKHHDSIFKLLSPLKSLRMTFSPTAFTELLQLDICYILQSWSFAGVATGAISPQSSGCASWLLCSIP